MGRFDSDPRATTVTRGDALPGRTIPFGYAGNSHYGVGNCPNLPWTWGWAWPPAVEAWTLKPIFLPSEFATSSSPYSVE